MVSLNIPFFTPLYFKENNAYPLSLREKVINQVDQYFHLKTQTTFIMDPPHDPELRFIRKGTFSKKATSSNLLILALKILSYITVIIPVCMLLAKFLLRSLPERYNFLISSSPSLFVKDSEQPDMLPLSRTPSPQSPTPYLHLLETPTIQLTSSFSPYNLPKKEVEQCLQEIMEIIFEQKQHPTIKITYLSLSVFICFELPDNFPGIVFKIAKPLQIKPFKEIHPLVLKHISQETRERSIYATVIAKQLSSSSKKYNHLYVPEQMLFQTNHSTGPLYFIAEEKLALHRDKDTDLIWKIKAHELQPAFKDLTVLIQETGLFDIKPNNCPPYLIDGKWSLALIDLGKRSAKISLKTVPKGLLELISYLHSKKNMLTVLNASPKQYHPALKKAIRTRLQELSIMCTHEQFHLESQTHPYKVNPIKLNDCEMNKLELNLNDTFYFENDNSYLSMKEAVCEVIEKLNTQIKHQQEVSFVSRAPKLVIDPTWAFSDKLNAACYHDDPYHLDRSKDSKELKTLWIRQILTAFVKNKIIRSWEVIPHIHADTKYLDLLIWC